jgi:glutathione peroxidase
MMKPTTAPLCLALFFAAACGSSAERTQASTAAPDASASPPAAAGATTDARNDTMNDLYSLKADSLDGKPVDLAGYRGKVTLVVNVASECGYTPQYAGLQKLHAALKDRGFAVLGFPSNDFGGQEPGSAEQIRQFCTTKYGVDFPMFAKVATKPGPQQSPVYAALREATGKSPNWNFCKYLVGKNGEVIAFYPSATGPESPELKQAIEAALR